VQRQRRGLEVFIIIYISGDGVSAALCAVKLFICEEEKIEKKHVLHVKTNICPHTLSVYIGEEKNVSSYSLYLYRHCRALAV